MKARAALPLAAAAVIAVALPSHAASAPAVDKTGWWSAASGGGVAAPQPSTADGDLRVARAVQSSAAGQAATPAALAAVLYHADGDRAVLQLKLRDQRVAGTPDIAACPTKGSDWAPGGNQPMSAAPGVDCGGSTSYGVLSADGTSITFTLDSRFQIALGTWSVALVPTPADANPGPPPSAPLPFTADLVAPEPGAFSAESAGGDLVPTDAPAAGSGSATVPVGSTDGSATASLAGGLGTAAVPAPAGDAMAGGVPLPAVVGAPTAGPVPAPAVAAPSARPVRTAASTPRATDLRLLAFAALVGLAAWLGRESAMPRPAPRLLGGRARIAGRTAGAPVGSSPSANRPRGLGRFATVRDAAPRRLR